MSTTKLVGFFAVAAVLIGAAVFVSWLIFGRSLNDDVRRMILTMSQLEQVRVKAEGADQHLTSLPLVTLPADGLKAHYGFAGAVDLTDAPRLSFDQDFIFQTSEPGGEIAGEMVRRDEGDYVYLTRTPQVGEVNLSAFGKQWIFIPKDFPLSTLFGLPSLQTLTDQDWQTLLALLQQIDLVDVKRTGIVEMIDGDATLPYEFTVHPEGMKTFLAAWWELRHGQAVDAATFQTIEQQVTGMADLTGVLSIGRRSFLLHRLTVKSPSIKLTWNFSDFNKAADIAAPELSQTKDVRQILSDLGFHLAALPVAGTGSDRESVIPTKDVVESHITDLTSSADPDEDGLDNALEFFYGTDPHNPDTDADGVSDGEEVTHGKNPKGSGGLFNFGLPF